MRKCIRCDSIMKENYAIKLEGGGKSTTITLDENQPFKFKKSIQPKAAICPQCGEVSIYIEDVSKLQS